GKRADPCLGCWNRAVFERSGGGLRVDDLADDGHTVAREAAAPGVLPDDVRVLRLVDAVDLVPRDVAVQPAVRDAQRLDHAVRRLGYLPKLVLVQAGGPGYRPLDDELRHLRLLPAVRPRMSLRLGTPAVHRGMPLRFVVHAPTAPYQSGRHGLRDRGGAVLNAKLLEYRRDVVLRGLRRDRQAMGDLRVRKALDDQFEDLSLARRQVRRMGAGGASRATRDTGDAPVLHLS